MRASPIERTSTLSGGTRTPGGISPLRSAAPHDRLPAGFQIAEQAWVFLHRFQQPRLELREPPCLVVDQRGEPWLSAFSTHDHHPCEVVEGSDLHPWEVTASVADLLRGLACERDEGDLFGRCDPGAHRVPRFRDHRVGFAGPGAGDDQGAIFLDDDRAALVSVQIAECGVREPLLEELFIGRFAARLIRRTEPAVEVPS